MLEQELVRYGYFILMAGVMVEGEAFLLAAAFLAHRGYLNIAAVIAIAAFGNALADQIYYQIARAKGREYFDRKAAEDPKVGRLHGWVQRRGAVLLFVSRFLFGFRIAIPAACGAVGMPARVFIPVNAAGSLMWAIVVGLGGYAFGNAADLFLSGMREYEGYVAAGIVVVGVVLFAFRSIDVRRTWGAVKRPPQAMVDLVGEMWSATHRAGRLALTRPTVRLAALVVAFGALNIATAVFAWRFALIERFTLWVPLEVAHGTRPVTLLVGLLLVALGRGLARRKRVAWALALGAVGFSVFLHLGHAASVLRAGVSVILLAELWRHQGEFTARSDPLRLRQALGAAVVLVVALTLFGIADIQRHVGGRVGLGAAFAETWRMAAFQDPVWMGLEPRGANVVWAIRLLAVAGASFILLLALAPVVLRSEPAEDLGPIRALAWKHGFDSLSYFAGQADKRHLVVEGGAFVGYRVESRVAVVAGDPVGRPESIRAAITRFVELCRENDWVPVFYETSARYLALYREAGLRWFKVGEEAVVPLASFSLQGPKVAKVRQAVNKIEREAPDLRVVEYRRDPADPEMDDQLVEVSAEWLSTKKGGELGFNLGVFSVEDLGGTRTFVALDGSDYVSAFVTWLPYRGGKAVVLDAMRRRSNAPAGVMELLISKSMLVLKAEGLEAASLATAPLANADDASGVSIYDRGVRLVFDRFSSFYGYRSLFHFKRKFGPAWEGRYLVFPRPDLLPRIAYALVAVHTPGGLLSYLKRQS